MLWLQGGTRQFHSTLLDSSLQTSPLRYLVPPPCACAQCCVSWSSCPLFTSLVTSEEALRVSSVFLLVLWFRCSKAVLCSHAQIRKPSHQNMKLPCEICSFHWKGLSVWSSFAGLPSYHKPDKILFKETVTKPNDSPSKPVQKTQGETFLSSPVCGNCRDSFPLHLSKSRLRCPSAEGWVVAMPCGVHMARKSHEIWDISNVNIYAKFLWLIFAYSC